MNEQYPQLNGDSAEDFAKETKIGLYMCDECDTAMSLKAIGWCDDERTLCNNCFNGAIARAELNAELSHESEAEKMDEIALDTH